MATQLKSIVRFVDVDPGDTVSLPHGLAWSPPGGGEQPQVPDVVWVASAGWTVIADDVNVTATNDQGARASVNCYAVLWHTIERAFGDKSILELIPRPLIINPGASGGAGSDITYLPDVWELMDVSAGLTDEVVPSEASQLFDEVTVNRELSILGIRTRFTGPVLAGDLTAIVSVNGFSTPAVLLHTDVINPSGGGAQFPPGFVTVAPGDQVGVLVTTSADFLPDGQDDRIDMSVWLEVGGA